MQCSDVLVILAFMVLSKRLLVTRCWGSHTPGTMLCRKQWAFLPEMSVSPSGLVDLFQTIPVIRQAYEQDCCVRGRRRPLLQCRS